MKVYIINQVLQIIVEICSRDTGSCLRNVNETHQYQSMLLTLLIKYLFV